MKIRQVLSMGLAVAIASGASAITVAAGGQRSALVTGTAKNEAKKPYTDYQVRARNVEQGQIGGVTPLDGQGNFSLANLTPAQYSIELLNRDGKVICTEGPFNLTQQLSKEGVNINCNKVPAAWWLLGAAAAAGVTAGVLAASSAQ
jgi:hypothetical protein